MMLFFNCFDFCDLSEIFFDGLCAFVEIFFSPMSSSNSLCVACQCFMAQLVLFA